MTPEQVALVAAVAQRAAASDAFGWSPPESAPDAIRRSGREFIARRV